jgi:mono/diheme cytochrome c family protein
MKAMFLAVALASGGTALAAEPAALLAGYQADAKKIDPSVAASVARGESLFNARHDHEWSCASCHGSPPTVPGKHAKTGKAIAPLAPKANAERFVDAAKAEKWFRRNCNDVLGRACTPLEKADVLAFLLK